MPLKEYNRALLKTVFKSYRVGEFLPIDLLSDKEGFDENNKLLYSLNIFTFKLLFVILTKYALHYQDYHYLL